MSDLIQTRKPTHPGGLFKRQYIDRFDMTIVQAAKYLGVTRGALTNFINEKSACSTEMASRIAAATGTSVALWINMQSNLNTWEAETMATPEVTKFPSESAA